MMVGKKKSVSTKQDNGKITCLNAMMKLFRLRNRRKLNRVLYRPMVFLNTDLPSFGSGGSSELDLTPLATPKPDEPKSTPKADVPPRPTSKADAPIPKPFASGSKGMSFVHTFNKIHSKKRNILLTNASLSNDDVSIIDEEEKDSNNEEDSDDDVATSLRKRVRTNPPSVKGYFNDAGDFVLGEIPPGCVKNPDGTLSPIPLPSTSSVNNNDSLSVDTTSVGTSPSKPTHTALGGLVGDSSQNNDKEPTASQWKDKYEALLIQYNQLKEHTDDLEATHNRLTQEKESAIKTLKEKASSWQTNYIQAQSQLAALKSKLSSSASPSESDAAIQELRQSLQQQVDKADYFEGKYYEQRNQCDLLRQSNLGEAAFFSAVKKALNSDATTESALLGDLWNFINSPQSKQSFHDTIQNNQPSNTIQTSLGLNSTRGFITPITLHTPTIPQPPSTPLSLSDTDSSLNLTSSGAGAATAVAKALKDIKVRMKGDYRVTLSEAAQRAYFREFESTCNSYGLDNAARKNCWRLCCDPTHEPTIVGLWSHPEAQLDWTIFRKFMMDRVSNMSPMSALAKLESIQQKGRIMEYTDEFATLLQQCKQLSDEQIRLFFLRGLKSEDMREKIVTYCHYFNLTQGRTPSFSELRDKAMEEETLQREFHMLTDAHAAPVVSQSINAVSRSHGNANASSSSRPRTGRTSSHAGTYTGSRLSETQSSSSSAYVTEDKEQTPKVSYKDLVMALPDPSPSKTSDVYKYGTVSSKFVLLAESTPRKPFVNIIDNFKRLRPVMPDTVCDKCGTKGDHDSDQCRYYAVDNNPYYNYVGNQRKKYFQGDERSSSSSSSSSHSGRGGTIPRRSNYRGGRGGGGRSYSNYDA